MQFISIKNNIGMLPRSAVYLDHQVAGCVTEHIWNMAHSSRINVFVYEDFESIPI